MTKHNDKSNYRPSVSWKPKRQTEKRDRERKLEEADQLTSEM